MVVFCPQRAAARGPWVGGFVGFVEETDQALNRARAVRVAIVIPARLESTRLPRKLLLEESGKYLIQHVYEGVVETPGVDRVIIATDSDEIYKVAEGFQADVVMTSRGHVSGTDRVAEVAIDLEQDVIVNVQGDEPCVCAEDIELLISPFRESEEVVMSTLAYPSTGEEGYRDPDLVKVVVDRQGNAVYFSRAPIPHYRDLVGAWAQHIGIYAYRKDFLFRLANIPPSSLEKTEQLEQLRAIENGYPIRVLFTKRPYRGIDTPQDYDAFLRSLGKRLKNSRAPAP